MLRDINDNVTVFLPVIRTLKSIHRNRKCCIVFDWVLTGSLILRVAGTSAGRHVWLDEYLEPMVHFLPVAPDLSDLESQISWAERHPRECEDMASTARELAISLLTPEAMITHLHQKIK